MKNQTIKLHSQQKPVNRNCGTCEHRKGHECRLSWRSLNMRQYYHEVCDENYSSWQRKRGLIERVKVWLWGEV